MLRDRKRLAEHSMAALIIRSRAIEACEPRQGRNAAALSSSFSMCRGSAGFEQVGCVTEVLLFQTQAHSFFILKALTSSLFYLFLLGEM